MKKTGFTLMELMVYIAIVGVVVIVAGQAFSNSTKMRVRTESMIKANASVEEAGQLMQEDVAQMGAKSAKESGDGTASDEFFKSKMVYMDPDNGDSSSFRLNGDSLILRRMHYDSQGRYVSIEEVAWFKRDDQLFRTCKTINRDKSRLSSAPETCPESNPPAVEVLDNVESFNAVPAKPAVLKSDYNSAGTSPRLLPSTVNVSDPAFRLFPRVQGNEFFGVKRDPERGGSIVTLSEFKSNFDEESEEVKTTKKAIQVFVVGGTGDIAAASAWSDVCSRVNLEPNVEYEITFKVPFLDDNNIRSFTPGMDHMTVGFRNLAGEMDAELPDFSFYPPIDASANNRRSMRFSVKNAKKNLCLAFTFAFYSPMAPKGKIPISNLELKKVESSKFVFDDAYTPDVSDKAKVKAFKLKLQVSRNGEKGNIALVVPTPSNGPKD
ncbi:MAG: prepilin-type N-terminal cleavage/methylation domain-containing protein [Fibrobacter sp.]|nr:prepilin-type N-terminal cleavage/methylation domain-containing protein [Fibrobacter sp.]